MATDKKKADSKADAQLEKRPFLSNNDKRTLISILIRNTPAFEAVAGVLKVENFPPADYAYSVAWRICTEFYEEHGKLPGEDLMFAEVQSAIDGGGATITQTDEDDLQDLLSYAYDPKAWADEPVTSATHTKWAIRRAQRLCEEHVIIKATAHLLKGDRIAINLPELLEATVAGLGEAHSLSDVGDTTTFPEGWDKEGGIVISSTDMSFFDNLMGGGDSPTEVYGLIGPTGSCKTTLGLQRVVRGAEQAQKLTNATGVQHYAVFVSYETPIKEIRIRMMSCAAKVPRVTLQKLDSRGVSALSNSTCLLEYEKKMWETKILEDVPVNGEQERVAAARNILQAHTIVLDLSGSDHTRRGCGGGYVSEVARLLNAELRRRGGGKIHVVVMDYAGLAVNRYLEEKNLDVDRNMRLYLKRLPSRTKELIAIPFQCPVYWLQQSSTEANSRPPGSAPHHTDAAECKAFADNCDFAMALGTQTTKGLCQLVASKTRRAERHVPAVIKIVGRMSVVRDTSKTHTVDQLTRTIKRIDVIKSVTVKAERMVHTVKPSKNRVDVPDEDDDTTVAVTDPQDCDY